MSRMPPILGSFCGQPEFDKIFGSCKVTDVPHTGACFPKAVAGTGYQLCYFLAVQAPYSHTIEQYGFSHQTLKLSTVVVPTFHMNDAAAVQNRQGQQHSASNRLIFDQPQNTAYVAA